VLGDNLDNTIEVSRNVAGSLLVNGGSVRIFGGTPTVASVQQIQIFGLVGNDFLQLDETNGALPRASLFGGAGNDTLIGGSDSDMLFGGAGNDTFVWNPGAGSDLVEGQGGHDTVQFNGFSASENINLAANGSRLRLTRDDGNVTMDVNGVEQVNIAALGGADNLTVNDLSGTDVTDVAIDLAGTPGSGVGDGQADTVIVNGTAGDDVLIGGPGVDTLDGGTGNNVLIQD